MDTAGTVNERRVGPMQWIMPLAWCAVTAIIVASGLNVELAGGPTAAGFGYVFLVAGYGAAFKQGLALYSIAAAVLGLGFMLVPRMTAGKINKGLAWSTLALMAIGGLLMLVAPQVLVAMAGSPDDAAYGVARSWAVTWMEAGSRVSISGAAMGLATFGEAFWSRWSHSPASSS